MRTIIILFSFCSVIFAQHPDMDFPLHIGNRWQYSESGFYTESIAVCDTTMPNGLTYTKIVGALFSGLYRKEGPRVYKYYTSLQKDTLKYDFSLATGDTLNFWQSEGGTIVLTTVTEQGTKNLFGQNHYYMVFMMDELDSSWDGSDVIADGIGLTQYFGEMLFYGLSGAVINGVQYGEIVDIEKELEGLPDDYLLEQNYPNPFNPSTIIRFKIKEAGKYSLKVYNTLGQLVETLSESYYNAGTHNVKFEAKNLGTGIYFYRLTGNNVNITKKMMYLK